MPSAPNSWQMYQAIQYLIFNECKVGGVTPFSPFSIAPNTSNPGSASDQTRYGANPQGTVTSAIYIGVPKDWTKLYPKQVHIIPPMGEEVFRRAFGGKVWDWQDVLIRVVMSRKDDWYQSQQDIIAARDALWPVLTRHAELPNAPGVVASLPAPVTSMPAYGVEAGMPIGLEWDYWCFRWRIKQEWSVTGGIIP